MRARPLGLWNVMQDCVRAGCETGGVLPGGLKVARRAPRLYRDLMARTDGRNAPLHAMDRVNVFAMAVNEGNAAGVHRVSLDAVIRTVRETGRDVYTEYKETSPNADGVRSEIAAFWRGRAGAR